LADLQELEQTIRACRRCEATLRPYAVEPRPIFAGGAGHPVLLIGQAPGITEYRRGAPFQGEAGQSIRKLFADCGLRDFDARVYQTSVTKCFPGRRAGASSDRMPGASEVRNCRPFLAAQLSLMRPRLVVLLGGLAWRAFLGLREEEQPGSSLAGVGVADPRKVRVQDMVGRRLAWRDAIVLPMIHPAGSANGARAAWPGHDRASKVLLAEALRELGLAIA
jgi:uracil-DNA glycosylase